MIAVRFSSRKKLDAVLDLEEMFQSIAMHPFEGITSDDDVIDPEVYKNFKVCYHQVRFFPLKHWVICLLVKLDFGHFYTLREKLQFLPCFLCISLRSPTRSTNYTSNVIKKDTKNPFGQVGYGLVQILNDWVKNQREAEEEMTVGLTEEQHAFVESNTKKLGCSLPPASSLLSKINIEANQYISDNLDKDQIDLIRTATQTLGCSSYPWSCSAIKCNVSASQWNCCWCPFPFI